jgi:hypothetical protein
MTDFLSYQINGIYAYFISNFSDQNFIEQNSPWQEVGLGNRGRLKVLNDAKLVLNEHQ